MENHQNLFFKDTEQNMVNDNETQKEARYHVRTSRERTNRNRHMSGNWNDPK